MVIPKAGAYVNIVHIIAIKYDNDKSKQLEKNRVRVEQRAMPSSARARPP